MNSLNALGLVVAMAVYWILRIGVLLAAGATGYYFTQKAADQFIGDPLNPAQKAKVDSALNIIRNVSGIPPITFGAYQKFLSDFRYPKVRNMEEWGKTSNYSNTYWFKPEAFTDLPDDLFAALLLHELVHTKQRVGLLRGTFQSEFQAYSVESHFLSRIFYDRWFVDPRESNRNLSREQVSQFYNISTSNADNWVLDQKVSFEELEIDGAIY